VLAGEDTAGICTHEAAFRSPSSGPQDIQPLSSASALGNEVRV